MISVESNYLDIKLEHPSYGEEPFVTTEFLEDKNEMRFIRTVERLVRTSEEYKRWLTFVHCVLGEDCICYQTGERMDFCSIHLHHHPITLFDLVKTCIYNTEGFTTFGIAQEVMSWHYQNWVGFVPLCSTSHEKYHKGGILVPIDIVEGNWERFCETVDVPEDVVDKINALKQVHFEAQPQVEWSVKTRRYACNDDAPQAVYDDTFTSRTRWKDDWNEPNESDVGFSG